MKSLGLSYRFAAAGVVSWAALLSGCGGACENPRRCENANSPGVEECIDGRFAPCRTDICLAGESRNCPEQQGVCRGSTQKCENGVWSPCSTVPTDTEICDGKDHDCDGVPGNGCKCTDGNTRSCPEQRGACAGSIQSCESGVWGACSRSPTDTEVCDGEDKDDDCDGAVNEGCACVNETVRPCAEQRGECRSSVQTCNDGVWSECSTLPSKEVCDGKDNDCNGQFDEGCPCTSGTREGCGTDLGECTAGVRTCGDDSNWGECVGAEQPKSMVEICDGKDNDCNGVTDEGCPCTTGARETCGTDLGECKAGVRTCQDGNWRNCVGATQPDSLIEVCDGKDNDCDGDTDEGCPCQGGATQPCGTDLGECTSGTQTCVTGNWGPCVGASEPEDRAERCDGLDNDCDGDTDEGCPCVGGATRACGIDLGECTSGTQTCVAGNWGPCEGAHQPADMVEVCDKLDNDCDGTTDETFVVGAPCATAESCPGTTVCTTDGAAARCAADSARFGDEICDGLDNDCDGLIDYKDEEGRVVSKCECGVARLAIGRAVDASLPGNPHICAQTRCGGDFVPRRAVDNRCYPICPSNSTDPDGDGWGFENGATCLVDGRAAWLRSSPCPGEGFPTGMSMAYCIDCSAPNNLPYAMCQSVPRFDLTRFNRGEQWLKVDYTFEAANLAVAPVNLWFLGPEGLRKRFPLVGFSDPPGRRQTRLFRIDDACFMPSTAFGAGCTGPFPTCEQCNSDETCGSMTACSDYDLSLAWLQIAAEFCNANTERNQGTVTLHSVELVEPNCSE